MHPSNYHKPSVALPSLPMGVALAKEQYNRVVSAPEPGVLLVEPLQTIPDEQAVISQARSMDGCAVSAHVRYCAVTGFNPTNVKIDKDGSFYTATIKLTNLVCIGTGQLVGKAGVVLTGKGALVTDTFNIHQLQNAESTR